MSIFEMISEESATDNVNSSILPPETQISEKKEEKTETVIAPIISANKPKKQPSAFYQTYIKLVEKYEGFLILLKLGDFYEAFKDHATTLATELNLTLTGRDVGLDERIPMVGIPYHAIDSYINKLVEREYKVILAEDLKNVLEFKNIDEYDEPEELSEEEMREFDSYMDDEPEELPTVSKITEGVEIEDNNYNEDCNEILNEESSKAFNKEAICIISDLLNGEITLA